mmetsp:Transcript_6925/g.10099  ORF Transcript_6925/g.10099 Transcript_6925/m.10099 type:complete len:592 (-) Transcript_6925:2363-4138(-)
MFRRSSKSKKDAVSAESIASEESTVAKSNISAAKLSPAELKKELVLKEIAVSGMQKQLKDEKSAKRKLFSSLAKLAGELKRQKNENEPIIDAVKYANRSWYEGGMWRPPAILPGVANQQIKLVVREDLSHLFFSLVLVTAFTRVGLAVVETGELSLEALLYFAVFWMIWAKDINYSTRFDTTDLYFESINLLTCVAVLCGSLSASSSLTSEDSTRIMMMAAFVAALHIILHCRVAISFRNAPVGSVQDLAKKHAIFSTIMTLCETTTWITGAILPELSERRLIIFALGICFSIARVPKNFLGSDFHVASTRRAVLFTLYLGFLLQSVLVAASPFFSYQSPTVKEYGFIGGCGVMLYCIKLFYSDDAPKHAQDHALLVNSVSAFLFNIFHFFLLLSLTVLGSGLDLLTHSYFAATTALPRNAKQMVCGGFGAVIFSIFLIKLMHMKRIPIGQQKYFFVGVFFIQSFVTMAVVAISGLLCLDKPYFGALLQDEWTLIVGLAIVTFFLVILSWLDEMVELSLYESEDDSRKALVHPFGLWWCFGAEIGSEVNDDSEQGKGSPHSSYSPLLGSERSTRDGEEGRKKDYATLSGEV